MAINLKTCREKELWEYVAVHLKKKGISVHSDNGRALALYEKLGFVVEGVRENDLKYGPDKYIDTILMSKKVK